MKSGKRLLTMLLVVFLLLATFSACTPAPSQMESQILEFPGTTWNSTPEAVREALNLSEKQIQENGEMETNTWLLAAAEVPCFGTTAKTVQFRFYRYGENGEYALAYITASFPEDTDMEAVKTEMEKLYGASVKEKPTTYTLTDGKVKAYSGVDTSSEVNLPTETPYVPNDWYWTAGISGTGYFSEKALDRAVAWFGSLSNPAGREAVLEYVEKQPLVTASWTDNDLWGAVKGEQYPSNVVVLDARQLVYLLRNFGE